MMYRYVLPCGHHTIQTVGEDTDPTKDSRHHYRCRTCGKKYQYKLDKKNNKLITLNIGLSDKEKQKIINKTKYNLKFIKKNNGKH